VPAEGEVGIYVSLAETEQELRAGARSHGWTLDDKVEIFELVPPESVLDPEQQQSLLYSSDLELGETTKRMLEAIERLKAEARRDRQPLGDPPAGAELAALPPPGARAEALFRAHQSTVLMLDDLTTESTDRAVHSIAHSVIPSRPACADLWRRAATAARRQVPRSAIPQRLP
jgi:circadian clock protein KaiC